MEITWYGHSCFRLTERGLASVVTDPFDAKTAGYSQLKLRADIVTVSHDAPGHNYVQAVKGYSQLITGPGEFEIGGVFVTGVQTNGHTKRDPGELRNTLYVYDFDGVTIAHLGDLRRVPSQTEVEALGTVHVALVPVGGGGGLTSAKASEVISLLEPGYVIPMHYGTRASLLKLAPLNKFLKEMGLNETEALPSLKVTKGSTPEETKVVLLDYDHA
ncbi:MAG: lactamase [Chloroflexi bacterium]|nr:MAG: lactamase [Chloroflexota bacterium]